MAATTEGTSHAGHARQRRHPIVLTEMPLHGLGRVVFLACRAKSGLLFDRKGLK
jgi:hypothetical protein